MGGQLFFGGAGMAPPGGEGVRKQTRTKTWNLGVPRWPVWSVWSAGSGPRRERGRLQKKNKDVEPFNLGLCPNLFLKRCSEGAYKNLWPGGDQEAGNRPF